MAAGPRELELGAAPRLPALGNGNRLRFVEVLGGAAFSSEVGRWRSLRHHIAAVNACTGTDVDEVVCLDHHLFIVLDDNDRVACIPQRLQALDEALVVSLVQAYAWLVQDVQHFGQPASDLRREPNALGLATGQGAGRSVKGQVVEADVDQEPQSRIDLLERFFQNDTLLVCEPLIQGLEPLGKCGQVHLPQFRDILAAQFELQTDGLEPRALARWADFLLHEPARPAAEGDGIAAFGGRLNGGDYAFPVDVAARSSSPPWYPYVLFGSVQDFSHDLWGQVLDGGFEGVTGSIQERLYDLHCPVALDVAQWRDAPLLDALAVVGDNQ